MAKKDYKAMASGIIKQAGGADNIVSATHCMTRLRLVLRDRSKFDTDAVKQVPGVLNVIIQNGEYQVVIGQDVPDLYEEVVKIDGIQAGGSVQDDEAAAKDLAQDHGNIGNAILSFIGGTFSPVIPVLVAGGLTGAVLSLLTNVFGVSAESGTYTIFYAINHLHRLCSRCPPEIQWFPGRISGRDPAVLQHQRCRRSGLLRHPGAGYQL